MDGGNQRAAAKVSYLQDQVAVVTGASSGIGAAIARALAAQGVRLCLIGRHVERLECVAQKAREQGVSVTTCSLDLTFDPDVRHLQAEIERDLCQVDILVHAAGVLTLGAIETASVDDLDQQYRTNVRAPYLLTQVLLPLLIARRGQIVFINSSAGLQARAGVGQYAATKHALKAIADSLREEVHGLGVRVLSVFAGRTATPMQEAAHQSLGWSYQPESMMQPEDIAEIVVHTLCLPATAEVKEINIRPMPALSGQAADRVPEIPPVRHRCDDGQGSANS